MIILAIETSCDETAIALVQAEGTLRQVQGSNLRFEVLKNLVASQIETHRPYGGVVPNLAKREHQKNLPILLRKIFQLKSYAPIKIGSTVEELNSLTVAKRNSLTQAKRNSLTIDAIAVTVGPGLEPCLWTGITFAKQMCADLRGLERGTTRKIKLLGVNHLEGHLYSNWLQRSQGHPEPFGRHSEQSEESRGKLHEGSLTKSRDSSPRYGGAQNDKTILSENDGNIKFPAIALIVSGGHTILLKMDSLTKWKKLGETRDDAAGEAFDKVARLLGLPYPGGPEIQKLAEKGNPKAINFPRPMINDKNYEFSFSGLKTAVLYYLRDTKNTNPSELYERAKIRFGSFGSHSNFSHRVADVAASFQQAIVDVLVKKTIRAAVEFGAKSILLSGGVAANKSLRESLKFKVESLKLKFFVPPFEYNTDNAAMIAAAAYINHLRKKKYQLKAQANLNL